MPNISIFLHTLKSHTLREHITSEDAGEIRGLEMVCASTVFASDILYIGQAEDVAARLRQTQPEMRLTIICSGDLPVLDPYFRWDNLNMLTTDLSLGDLFNAISGPWTTYHRFKLTLADALCENQSIAQLIHAAGRLLKGHIFLLDPGYTCIGQYSPDDFFDPLARDIYTEGLLSYDHLKSLHEEAGSQEGPHHIHHYDNPGSDNEYYISPVISHDTVAARLLFIANASHKELNLNEMLFDLSNIFGHLLSISYRLPENGNNELLSLLADYEKQGTVYDHEIQNRFKLLPVRVKTFMQCIIVHFKEDLPSSMKELFMQKMSELLPVCNLTIWKGEIVVLHSSDERSYNPDTYMDVQAFSALLEEFHGDAIFSSLTRFPEKFFTLYSLCRRLLPIITQLELTPAWPHFYNFKDHLIYLTLDLAKDTFTEMIHHSEIIYLADPSVIALTRYDKDHNTNLTDLLYNYLLNGRNANKTAQDLFMHRNTVLNKLSKINEIINLPLEDGLTQQRLLFSCQLVRYYKDYLSIQLKL